MTPGRPVPSVQIALLRAVMPTGNNKVPMGELRAMLDQLGFRDARTLLSTGNAVFRSEDLSGPALERVLEQAITDRIGPRLDVMVRDSEAWSRLVIGNPFPAESEDMPSRVLATVFKETPPLAAARGFEAAIGGPECAKVVGDVAWVVYPEGVSASRLTPAVWKRHFGSLPGTARNWNTMRKLHEVAAAMAG